MTGVQTCALPICDGFICILDSDLCPYDDFNINRYQTLSYYEIYEKILNNYTEGEYSKFHIDKWRETVLNSDYGSFTYDW